ncbi:MAG TPA: GAF and ANTAR domain-containing protein [Acidimicrobiales bacterium]|nr:GAF and ANTAR domain-containing protein [Acidimicrobiales bacterium]
MALISLADHTLEAVLGQIIGASVDALAHCDGAGLTLAVDGSPVKSVATDARVVDLDAFQFDTSEGPCVTSLLRGTPQEIPSMRTDDRWPQFTRRAIDGGISSCLAWPLVVQGAVVGVINLYSFSDDGFAEPGRGDAARFAEQAAYVAANAYELAARNDDAARLSSRLGGDDVVAQAVGVLRQRHGISEAEARVTLADEASRRAVDVEEVAHGIVSRHGGAPAN